MEKRGVIELLKATRIHRTLTGISAALVPVAFADTINMQVILFMLCGVLFYAAAGIHNAKIDNDYALPGYAGSVVVFLSLLSLLISLTNMIFFVTILLYLILGIFYNKYSRSILFGDVTVLAFTHHTLPVISTSILLGIEKSMIIRLSVYMFITFWFLIHIKNLKDTEQDRKRGYRTFSTDFSRGREIILFLFELGFMCIFAAYFIFGFSIKYLIAAIFLFFLKQKIIKSARTGNEETALDLMRLMVLAFLFLFVIEETKNFAVLISGVGIVCMYLLFLAMNLSKNTSKEKKSDHLNLLSPAYVNCTEKEVNLC
ncbi:MAG: UbiA family prenyltransferase [Nanoarchaeota archaeon]|nr:UbiA family prenyltransferase [Nanoarchaeota archaeon]